MSKTDYLYIVELVIANIDEGADIVEVTKINKENSKINTSVQLKPTSNIKLHLRRDEKIIIDYVSAGL